MSLIRNFPIGTILLLPVLPRRIHLLLDAALFQEVAFLPLNESTDKHVALVDESDGDVGDCLVGALLDLLAEDG